MAQDEHDVSPEEKLLKVIQGEQPAQRKAETPDREVAVAVEPATADAPAPAALVDEAAESGAAPDTPEAVSEPAAAKAGVKPKLKPNARKAAAAKAKPGKKASAKAKPVSATVYAPVGLAPAKKQKEAGAFARLTTRGLGIAAALALMFAAAEIYGMISRGLPGDAVAGGEWPMEGLTGPRQLMPLDDLLALAVRHDIFGVPDAAPPPTDPGPGPTPQPRRSAWGEYARKNLRLIGLSARGDEHELEAIVVDQTNRKMYFLVAGETLPAGDQEVRVSAVRDDSLVLSDGRDEIIVR